MNLKKFLTGTICLGLFNSASAQDRMHVEGNRTNDNKYKFIGNHRPNIIAFAPLQFTENGVAGFSFSYERAIDSRSIVAFYLPAVVEFNLANTQNTGNTNGNSDPMFYLMPGIKLYPTGGFGPIAKYAIGPSLVIGEGQRTVGSSNYYFTGNYYEVQSHFLLGMIVNQSVNINPTPWLYIGCEFGMGFTYVDRVGGISQGTKPLVNFNFKIGLRY